uniref:Uncharacterized protein n=1 Tax=Arundo donax TaxID=35708 RepID=A0A0A9HAQ8_ARUDO
MSDVLSLTLFNSQKWPSMVTLDGINIFMFYFLHSLTKQTLYTFILFPELAALISL